MFFFKLQYDGLFTRGSNDVRTSEGQGARGSELVLAFGVMIKDKTRVCWCVRGEGKRVGNESETESSEVNKP